MSAAKSASKARDRVIEANKHKSINEWPTVLRVDFITFLPKVGSDGKSDFFDL